MLTDRQDLRVRYTQEVLRKSLLELLSEKSINDISVTDVCRRAGVNRGTFYNHYPDPYALLMHVENELYEKILNSVERANPRKGFVPLLEEVFSAIEANRDLCRILLSEKGDKTFLKKILDIAHDQPLADWKMVFGTESEAEYRLMYAFIVSGSVGVIQDWIDGGFRRSAGEMATFISSMIMHGISKRKIDPNPSKGV